MPEAQAQAARRAPRWFELGTLGACLALAAVGSIGLLLAVAGRYRTDLALLLGLPLAALGVAVLVRGRPTGPASRPAHAGAAIALVLAAAFAAFAGATPSQNVVLERDPGSYMTTARWLADEGTLEIDARDGAFEDVAGLRFAGAAVYDVGTPPPAPPGAPPDQVQQSGELETQFNHLAPVALAAAYDLGGHRLLFRLPALAAGLALLAIYAVAVRATGRPLVALLAPAVLGACTPLLYVARNTYSEPFATALLWGAVLVLLGLHDRPRPAAGAVGGFLLGAVVCTRIDALLYVALVPPLAAVSIALASDRAQRTRRAQTWAAVLATAAAVGAVGWYDLVARTGAYERDLADQLGQLRTGLVASVALSAVGLALWSAWPAGRDLAHRWSRPAAWAGAAVVGGALLFGWLVRPQLGDAQLDLVLSGVAKIQERTGLPIEPDRSYAEDSLRWMAWYLGAPALAAAIGAIVVATWRALRGSADAALVGLLVLCLGGSAVYWYDPNITPDQLWATRRFVPAAFPSLAVWAT
ncbi:MAG TPA: hypothetical protein VHK88_10060, partial [Aquihabitans sp.]|nr:hypothetical protein [Aquihabitans sp.]